MNAVSPFQAPPQTVLFVCRDNSRRSLIAEALLRDRAMGGVRSFSAGLVPAGHADPYALSALALAGLDGRGLWPKHWRDFQRVSVGEIDTVVMMGEDVAAALPRDFPGNPDYLLWRLDGRAGLRPLHRGVWHDIQMIRPEVDALAEDLRLMRDFALAPANDRVPAE